MIEFKKLLTMNMAMIRSKMKARNSFFLVNLFRTNVQFLGLLRFGSGLLDVVSNRIHSCGYRLNGLCVGRKDFVDLFDHFVELVEISFGLPDAFEFLVDF